MTTVTRKNQRRLRGAQTRVRQQRLGVFRIVARLSGRHTYAQLVAPDGRVLAAASTAQKSLRGSIKGNGANVSAAAQVGEALARAAGGIQTGQLAFDRGGRKYHGRMRAMAEAMRAGGMKF